MHKIALITLTALPLFAGFFPQATQSTISSIEGHTVHLSTTAISAGMSGVVIHNYGNDIQAITSRVVTSSNNKITLLNDDIIQHDKLPTINTKVAIGDKVIGGYLYNNILLLAPDEKTYANITKSADKNWIHPDLYALFLEEIGETSPTKENLKRFAKTYQVGLIYIVSKEGAKLLDPISGKVISKKSIQGLPETGKAPFYMRFSKINAGLFSSSNTQAYYKLMETL